MTDPQVCAQYGHLPRRILRPHQTIPGATYEACLRCGSVLCCLPDGRVRRSTSLMFRAGRVVRASDRPVQVNHRPGAYQHVDMGEAVD